MLSDGQIAVAMEMHYGRGMPWRDVAARMCRDDHMLLQRQIGRAKRRGMHNPNPSAPNRMAAIESGSRFFFTDKPCKRGHTYKRYASTGACVICAAICCKAYRRAD